MGFWGFGLRVQGLNLVCRVFAIGLQECGSQARPALHNGGCAGEDGFHSGGWVGGGNITILVVVVIASVNIRVLAL